MSPTITFKGLKSGEHVGREINESLPNRFTGNLTQKQKTKKGPILNKIARSPFQKKKKKLLK